MAVVFAVVKALDLHFIQLPQLYSLEAQSDEKDISRIKVAFNALSKEFGVINYDNAVWDETYDFINNRNQSYTETNFVVDAYKSLGLNGIHFYDREGNIVWHRAWNKNDWSPLSFSPFDLPSPFVKAHILVSEEMLKKNDNKPITRAGYTLLDNKVVLFAATSIFKANLQGNANGNMLFWRLFSDDTLDDLQQRSGIKFKVEVITATLEESKKLTSKNSFMKGSYRTEQGEIYSFIPFITGKGGMKVSYLAPQRQFTSTWLNHSTVITSILFLLTLVIFSFFTHYIIIRPILKADKMVAAIIHKNDHSVRFSSKRKDELGTLFNLIDRLLDDVVSSEQELISHNIRLQTISRTDGLTNIPNRRAFDQYMTKLLSASTQNTEVSILICDVDYFKKYNDCYGHALGDKTLCLIADCLRKNLHEDTDFIARYGGEEFVIILNDTNQNNSLSVANNLVAKVKALGIVHQDSEVSDVVTISIGVHAFTMSGQQEYMSLFEMADKALYKAKDQGRNRACV